VKRIYLDTTLRFKTPVNIGGFAGGWEEGVVATEKEPVKWGFFEERESQNL
jgi:hypothetical protein